MANSPAPAPGPNNKPAHEVRLGAIKAVIWQNNTDSGVRYNVTFERLYNQEGEWRSTNSFGRDDLLLLGKVADLAHSWIIEPEPAEAGDPLNSLHLTAVAIEGQIDFPPQFLLPRLTCINGLATAIEKHIDTKVLF